MLQVFFRTYYLVIIVFDAVCVFVCLCISVVKQCVLDMDERLLLLDMIFCFGSQVTIRTTEKRA